MSDTKSPPTSTQVTDEDLITAVRQQSKKAGTPVVRTKDVAKAEHIDVTNQTVKRRLEDIDIVNSIQVGRGHVWWVPEEEAEARGEVDMSSVYLEKIDPAELPRELIEQHPDGPSSYWERRIEKGSNGVSMSLMAFLAGVLIFIVQELIPNLSTSEINTVGALLIVGGASMFLVSAGIAIVGSVFHRTGASNPRIWIRKKTTGPRDQIADWISSTADRISSTGET